MSSVSPSPEALSHPNINPWDLPPVREVLAEIEYKLDKLHFRTACYSRGLIDDSFKLSLSETADTAVHNSKLLGKLSSGGWQTFDTLLDILDSKESLKFEDLHEKLMEARDEGLRSGQVAGSGLAAASSAQAHDYTSASLATIQDLDQLGKEIQLHINNYQREMLAKAAVGLLGHPLGNFRDVIKDFIRDHERGRESAANVSGVLFYLAHSRVTTVREFLQLIERTSPASYHSVKALVEKAISEKLT